MSRRTLSEPDLICRTDALPAIHEGLDAVQEGRRACLVVTGEAGVGKSRLLTEIESLAETEARYNERDLAAL